MATNTNPFGVSFIQTAAGATITGDIKRYNTYKEMVTDPVPTRLASVANGSHDVDYPVNDDHVGGVLFQRDFITNTWVVLYRDTDMAVPTYIDWSHILNTPAWLGGVTHNRKKLTQDTAAELRTTYYSFGNYKLLIPSASLQSVPLGEEIVLEQYSGNGAILIPYSVGDVITSRAVIITDPDSGNQYQVIYTYSSYNSVNIGHVEYTLKISRHAYVFKLLCTEDDDGHKYWSLSTLDNDYIDAIQTLRREQTDHLIADNPHNQYILKSEIGTYIHYASIAVDGLVKLARMSDIYANNDDRAVTPNLLNLYVNNVVTSKTNATFNSLYPLIDDHINNLDIHITAAEKDAISDHMNNTDLHITVDEKNNIYSLIQEHSSNTEIHITRVERDRWNLMSSIDVDDVSEAAIQSALLAHNGDLTAHNDLFNTKVNVNHLTDNLAHSTLFAGKVNNSHLTDSDAHKSLFDSKQNVLVPGSHIDITGSNIGCTLTGGTNISIGDDGSINCTLPSAVDATTEVPGIVKLTNYLTTTNKNNSTTAVTPNALNAIPLNSILRHLTSISNKTTTFDLCDQTYGNIILPFTINDQGHMYNVVIQWGLSQPTTVTSNTYRYMFINNTGYNKLRSILFVDVKPYDNTVGKWDTYATSNMNIRLLAPVHIDPNYDDPVAALLLMYDRLNGSGSRTCSVFWTVVGLAYRDIIWDSQDVNTNNHDPEILATHDFPQLPAYKKKNGKITSNYTIQSQWTYA